MPRLAVIILTKNEEANIEEAMESATFADEIVIIDSGSTDRTQELAEKHGAKFVSHPMDENGFAGQRNFALTQTNMEWVFFLDADERISSMAKDQIRHIVQCDNKGTYSVERKNILFGQLMRYGAHRPDYVCRFFPRQGSRWVGIVHEHVESDWPKKYLRDCLRHCTYKTWEQYFSKFNNYTSLSAKEMMIKEKKITSLAIFLHSFGAFLKSYILKQGIRDGFLGLVMSFMAAMYVMVKYMKLKNMQRLKDSNVYGRRI